jgi:hypothetical protein
VPCKTKLTELTVVAGGGTVTAAAGGESEAKEAENERHSLSHAKVSCVESVERS